MDIDLAVKLAIYRHFAETGARPSAADVAERACLDQAEVAAAFERLRAQRVLVLEPDGVSIRMAPPFSGVPTQHTVVADGISYFANCAWDTFGIPAALGKTAIVRSRCEQSLIPLELEVGRDVPPASTWWFHCAVPASQWWNDIVFT